MTNLENPEIDPAYRFAAAAMKELCGHDVSVILDSLEDGTTFVETRQPGKGLFRSAMGGLAEMADEASVPLLLALPESSTEMSVDRIAQFYASLGFVYCQPDGATLPYYMRSGHMIRPQPRHCVVARVFLEDLERESLTRAATDPLNEQEVEIVLKAAFLKVVGRPAMEGGADRSLMRAIRTRIDEMKARKVHNLSPVDGLAFP